MCIYTVYIYIYNAEFIIIIVCKRLFFTYSSASPFSSRLYHHLNPNYYKKHQHNMCCRLFVCAHKRVHFRACSSFFLQFVPANLARKVSSIWCDPAGRFDLTFLTVWEDAYVLGCLEDSALKSWRICRLIATQLTSENPLNDHKKEVKWWLVQQWISEGVFQTIAQTYYTTPPHKIFLLWMKSFFPPFFLLHKIGLNGKRKSF